MDFNRIWHTNYKINLNYTTISLCRCLSLIDTCHIRTADVKLAIHILRQKISGSAMLKIALISRRLHFVATSRSVECFCNGNFVSCLIGETYVQGYMQLI